MPEIGPFFENLGRLYVLITNARIPNWLLSAFAFVLAIYLLLRAVEAYLSVTSQIRTLWLQNWWPVLHNSTQRRRAKMRQQFAEHVEYEIRRLSLQENWRDDRFAELEAEIEAEGRTRDRTLIPFVRRTRQGLRREKSLSLALATSKDRLLLVEGEPGSGKSVALRHVALQMAQRARRIRRTTTVLPVYVNL